MLASANSRNVISRKRKSGGNGVNVESSAFYVKISPKLIDDFLKFANESYDKEISSKETPVYELLHSGSSQCQTILYERITDVAIQNNQTVLVLRNKLILQTLRDILSEEFYEETEIREVGDATSFVDRNCQTHELAVQIFHKICVSANEKLDSNLKQLAQPTNRSQMDSDQKFLLYVFNDCDLDLNEAVPPIFWMHIGRLLGYPTCPSSASFQHAGITFLTRLFCQSLYEGYSESSIPFHKCFRALLHPNIPLDVTEVEEDNHDEEECCVLHVEKVFTASKRDSAAKMFKVVFYKCLYETCKADSERFGRGSATNGNTQIDMAFDKAREYYNKHCATWELPILESEEVIISLKKTANSSWKNGLTSDAKEGISSELDVMLFLEDFQDPDTIKFSSARNKWKTFFAYKLCSMKGKAESESMLGRYSSLSSLVSTTSSSLVRNSFIAKRQKLDVKKIKLGASREQKATVVLLDDDQSIMEDSSPPEPNTGHIPELPTESSLKATQVLCQSLSEIKEEMKQATNVALEHSKLLKEQMELSRATLIALQQMVHGNSMGSTSAPIMFHSPPHIPSVFYSQSNNVMLTNNNNSRMLTMPVTQQQESASSIAVPMLEDTGIIEGTSTRNRKKQNK